MLHPCITGSFSLLLLGCTEIWVVQPENNRHKVGQSPSKLSLNVPSLSKLILPVLSQIEMWNKSSESGKPSSWHVRLRLHLVFSYYIICKYILYVYDYLYYIIIHTILIFIGDGRWSENRVQQATKAAQWSSPTLHKSEKITHMCCFFSSQVSDSVCHFEVTTPPSTEEHRCFNSLVRHLADWVKTCHCLRPSWVSLTTTAKWLTELTLNVSTNQD